MCMRVYADYYVIPCNYVLGANTVHSQCKPPSAYKCGLYKKKKEAKEKVYVQALLTAL